LVINYDYFQSAVYQLLLYIENYIVIYDGVTIPTENDIQNSADFRLTSFILKY